MAVCAQPCLPARDMRRKNPRLPLMITSRRRHDLSFVQIFTSGFWNDARLSHYREAKVSGDFRGPREEGRVFGGGGGGGGGEAGVEEPRYITITHLLPPHSPPRPARGHLPSSDTGRSLSNYLQ